MSTDWLTAREIRERYGILSTSLELWCRKGCKALGGRKPRVWKGPSRGHPRNAPGRACYYYSRQDIEAIVAVEPLDGALRDAAGAWLTARAAQERYGRRLDLHPWRAAGCPALGGKRIRAKRIPAAAGGPRGSRRGQVWVYHENDVLRIAAAGASGRRVEPVPDPEWLTAAEALEEFGLGKHALLHWRKCCMYLGRPMKARRQKTTINGQVRTLWRYHRPDLQVIAERVSAAADTVRSESLGEWAPAAEIKKACGVRASILAYWRQDGRVRAKQIPTPATKASAHKLLWVYHVGDVLQAKAAPDGRTRQARQKQERMCSAETTDTDGPPLFPVVRIDQDPNYPLLVEVVGCARCRGIAEAEAAADPAPKPAQARGRPRSEATEEVYKFCYEAYISGKKLAQALADARKRFGRNAPKEEGHVRRNAQRYAKRHGLPLYRPS